MWAAAVSRTPTEGLSASRSTPLTWVSCAWPLLARVHPSRPVSDQELSVRAGGLSSPGSACGAHRTAGEMVGDGNPGEMVGDGNPARGWKTMLQSSGHTTRKSPSLMHDPALGDHGTSTFSLRNSSRNHELSSCKSPHPFFFFFKKSKNDICYILINVKASLCSRWCVTLFTVTGCLEMAICSSQPNSNQSENLKSVLPTGEAHRCNPLCVKWNPLHHQGAFQKMATQMSPLVVFGGQDLE